MLTQIKDWLEQQQLFSSNKPEDQKQNGNIKDLPQLTDTDYEFLFNQLLEGVANGWHEGRIVKFFERLGERGDLKKWIKWLKSFEVKLLASPATNRNLATRMLRLGLVTESLPFPEIKHLGEVAYNIGVQLLNRGTSKNNWDQELKIIGVQNADTPIEQNIPVEVEEEQLSSNLSSLDEFFVKLEENETLLEMEEMIKQLNEMNNDDDQQTQNLPDPVEAWFKLGIMQAEAQDWETALTSWEKTVELEPELAEAWHNQGTMLAQLGRLTEALSCFERSLELNPDNFSAWNNRGNALYNLKRWEGAIASWDKALSLQPDYYQAWYNRACGLEKLGLLKESLASYNKALEIKPDFPLAKYRRSNLLE